MQITVVMYDIIDMVTALYTERYTTGGGEVQWRSRVQ
jgi:hypothetical protein